MSINVSSVQSQSDLTIQITIPGNDPIKNIIYLDNLTPLVNKYNQIFNQFYNPHEIEPENLKKSIQNALSNNIENIISLKKEIDNIFEKHITRERVIINSHSNEPHTVKEGLDYALLDKISPLVPEGQDILLKQVVKEINGSAKGLSDFVVLFTKYRLDIIQYNKIEYFQKKGCHFLRKV